MKYGFGAAGKQRETIAEMRNVGIAMMEFITDEAGAAAAGASVFSGQDGRVWDPADYPSGRRTVTDLEALLARVTDPENRSFRYIDFVPVKDSWGRSYHYFFEDRNLLASHVAAIFSCGKPISAGDCAQAVPTRIGKFPKRCYASDLVWADGAFIAYPTAAEDDGDTACDDGAG